MQAQKLANKGKTVSAAPQINPFDGLIHEANGVRRFPDGTVVDGSNDGVGYIGLHDDDISFKPSMYEMELKEKEMKEVRAQMAINDQLRAKKEAEEAARL